MEILAHSHNTNASGATFNSIRGNQTNLNVHYNGPTTIYSLFGSGSSSHRDYVSHNYISRPLTDAEIPHERIPLTLATSHTADPVSVIKEAVVLIDHISTSLIDPTDSSNDDRDLQLVLGPIRQILCIAKHAIKAYEDKPLGQSLANVITPEVERCRMVLWELRDKLHDTWLLLVCTRISGLWRQVFRNQ
jgi:hypothetical protein